MRVGGSDTYTMVKFLNDNLLLRMTLRLQNLEMTQKLNGLENFPLMYAVHRIQCFVFKMSSYTEGTNFQSHFQTQALPGR